MSTDVPQTLRTDPVNMSSVSTASSDGDFSDGEAVETVDADIDFAVAGAADAADAADAAVDLRATLASAARITATVVTASATFSQLGSRRRSFRWLQTFNGLDPRQQIADYFRAGDSRGPGGLLDEKKLEPRPGESSSFFSVWRPTSMDAIRMMMEGRAVGKGLNVKGKSSQKGRLSGFVPFLQIDLEDDKTKVLTPSQDARICVYFVRFNGPNGTPSNPNLSHAAPHNPRIPTYTMLCPTRAASAWSQTRSLTHSLRPDPPRSPPTCSPRKLPGQRPKSVWHRSGARWWAASWMRSAASSGGCNGARRSRPAPRSTGWTGHVRFPEPPNPFARSPKITLRGPARM